MALELRYAVDALKDLKKLDKTIARRIALKIRENSQLKDPLSRAKALSGTPSGLYRYRIGDYRAIFEIDSKGIVTLLIVLRIKHRKEVYD